MWQNQFSQLFNVHEVRNLRQTEIYAAELLLPWPSASESEMAIEYLQGHKSLGIHQIPAELIKAES